MFTSILNSATGTLTIVDALICTITSLILGFIISIVYMANGRRSKKFSNYISATSSISANHNNVGKW